jgi:hypothetical protein
MTDDSRRAALVSERCEQAGIDFLIIDDPDGRKYVVKEKDSDVFFSILQEVGAELEQ